MRNKFKIRALENEKRRIDKEIAKLRNQEKEQDYVCIGHSVETNARCITTQNIHHNEEVHFNYTYYKKGNEIKCVAQNFANDGEYEGIGIAKCHTDDEFNLTVGLRLAYLRAMEDLHKDRTRKYMENL